MPSPAPLQPCAVWGGQVHLVIVLASGESLRSMWAPECSFDSPEEDEEVRCRAPSPPPLPAGPAQGPLDPWRTPAAGAPGAVGVPPCCRLLC